MRWRNDDFISVLAITSSAALSVGLTAFMFGRVDPAPVRVDVPTVVVEPMPRGITVRIPDNMRGITIKVDDVAALVRPGARVDVIVAPRDVPDGVEPVARVVLRSVPVTGNDRTASRSPTGDMTASSMVTLLVTPQDAEKVALAATEGTVHLVLRSPVKIGRLMVGVGTRAEGK
jgi:Flp pilus assembly protein CpaB